MFNLVQNYNTMGAPLLQIKDLTVAFEKENKVAVNACFDVASAPNVEALMSKYGFKAVGKYEGKYPIMLNKDIKNGPLGRYLR